MGVGSIRRLYYSIGEVSKVTELEPHVLRYWESEFSQLKPRKNKAGNRTYKVKDIQVVLQIKKLLYENKFTIEGAKLRLASGVEADPDQLRISFGKGKPQDLMKKVKRDLKEILSILDK